MLTKHCFGKLRSPVRNFSRKKPPKGFEKFFKKDNKNQSKHEENKEHTTDYKVQFEEFWSKLKASKVEVGFALAGLGLGTLLVRKYNQEPPAPLVTYQDFINEYLEKHDIQKLCLKKPGVEGENQLPEVEVIVNDKAVARIKVPHVNSFLKTLSQELKSRRLPQFDLETEVLPPSPYLKLRAFANLATIGALVFSFFVMFRMSRRNSNEMFNWYNKTQSNQKTFYRVYGANEKINVSFKDVAGLKEAKQEITEFVDFLKRPKRFIKLGARIPKGALLTGPPGTGKTLLAKATAGEAGVPFYTVSGSEFTEMYVGVGSSRVKELFAKAREKAPSIVFIDEIDAIGSKRSTSMGGNQEKETTLNQLLVEMDGFGTDSKVVVMASTNRSDILDPALLRSGRFDRTIELTLPDIEGREEIMHVHLRPLKLEPSMDVSEYAKKLAALTPGFSGAEISNLCNEAAITAARRSKEYVDSEDFQTASERVLGGLEKSKRLQKKERNIVAHHEAGHAVVGWFLEGADPVLKVSILPRSKGALGFAQFLPNETMLYSKEELIDKICAILGGRVAEELFFNEVSTGASDDLRKATSIAKELVTSYGMSKLGLVAYRYSAESFLKPFSKYTNKLIDDEVREILNNCLGLTRKILSEKKNLVAALAEALLEKERVVHQDLVEILGERPFEGTEEYNKYVNA